MASIPASRDGRLARDLRRWDLVSLLINAVIGAGIFGLPSRVYALAGTYSIFAYLVSSIAILLVVLCFAEVGSRFSETGGPYLYARTAFGPLIGFQVGWLVWIGRVASIASLSNLFVGYVTYFFAAAGTEPWRSCVIAALLLPLAGINMLGIRVTKTVTNTFTAAKLIPLLTFAFVGIFFIDPQRYSMAMPDYRGFSQAALLLMFTYTGFEAVTIPTGEIRNPQRHLPFGLFVGITIVASLYVLVQTVSIGTLPTLAESQRPLADASRRFLGPPGALMMAIGTLVSITGTQNASLFATPRLLFAMAENGQLPRTVGVTHRRYQTPVVAIAITAAVSLFLAIFSTFISALTISAVVRLLAYAVTCAALPVLRRRSDVPSAPFMAPAGPVISVIAAVLSLWLLSSSPAAEMRMSVVAMLVGFVLYAGFARGRT